MEEIRQIYVMSLSNTDAISQNIYCGQSLVSYSMFMASQKVNILLTSLGSTKCIQPVACKSRVHQDSWERFSTQSCKLTLNIMGLRLCVGM